MKLKHELPTEVDTFYSLHTVIDDYLALYEEELVTEEEYDYICLSIQEIYEEKVIVETQERRDIEDTEDSCRYQ